MHIEPDVRLEAVGAQVERLQPGQVAQPRSLSSTTHRSPIEDARPSRHTGIR